MCSIYEDNIRTHHVRKNTLLSLKSGKMCNNSLSKTGRQLAVSMIPNVTQIISQETVMLHIVIKKSPCLYLTSCLRLVVCHILILSLKMVRNTKFSSSDWIQFVISTSVFLKERKVFMNYCAQAGLPCYTLKSPSHLSYILCMPSTDRTSKRHGNLTF